VEMVIVHLATPAAWVVIARHLVSLAVIVIQSAERMSIVVLMVLVRW
jgi:hypothetical protein